MSGPVRIQPDPDAILEELRERDVWICWREEKRDGDLTKIPVEPGSDDRASATDPATWSDFATAWEHHTAADTETSGIGYVFSSGGPYVGVDLDDCRDPETGEIEEWARDVIAALDTYAEVSPSGTGVHAFVRGEKPDGGNRSGDVEIYDDARYFTATGEHLDATPSTIADRQDALEDVHAEYIGGDEARGSPDNDANPGVSPRGSGGLEGDDAQLIETARNASNGEKFRRLWSGDYSAYPSHSEADLALCGMLAFYTGPDPQRIDRLFRRSGLMRPKWDRNDYRERTIDKALAGRSEYYDPSGGRATADGGTAASSSAPAPSRDDGTWFVPGTVKAAAGLDEDASLSDLSDGQRAYYGWRVIEDADEYHIVAALPDGELYVYGDGVWETEGEQELRELGHRLLGDQYSRNVHAELCEQVRATTTIYREDMGTPDGTLAVANGLLDLETREVRDLHPTDYALVQLPVAFDPDAECPRWEQFIEESVEPDRRDALQEYVGYTLLVGQFPIHRVLLLVGGGQNGKSTFLNVVTELLGPENVTGFSVGDLAHDEYTRAEMFGAVANIDADVTGGLGHGGMFKKLSGGDRKVSARKPYGEPFSYHPTTKQLYSANEVPDTKVDDDAFFRRWLIAEFPTEFTAPRQPGPDKDPGLEEELLDELPGILNWALDGLDRLLEQDHFSGEGSPDEKRDRWRKWGDSVEKFIDRCIDVDADGKHTTADVYERYTAFCRRELGEEPESQSTVTNTVKKADGVSYSRGYRFGGVQKRGFKGFAFTDEAPDLETDPENAKQSRLSQHGAREALLEAVDELAGEDDMAPVEDLLEAVVDDVGSRDRAEHLLDKLLSNGVLEEPRDGFVRRT